eukprot:3312124-Rhodomonas_salina.1
MDRDRVVLRAVWYRCAEYSGTAGAGRASRGQGGRRSMAMGYRGPRESRAILRQPCRKPRYLWQSRAIYGSAVTFVPAQYTCSSTASTSAVARPSTQYWTRSPYNQITWRYAPPRIRFRYQMRPARVQACAGTHPSCAGTLLRACYGMSGTDLTHAMLYPGTDFAYGATRALCPVLVLTLRMVLRARYAVSCTDV